MSSKQTVSPKLYLFVGYPGAGKTTAAKAIEHASDAVHLWADRERREMFGEPTHEHSESVRLYEHLNQQTEKLLKQGKSVMFDTNFNFYSDREHLRTIAEACGAETVVIWISTSLAIAKARAVDSRVTRNGYANNMTSQQFDDIASKLEKPQKNEKVIKIDGAQLDAKDLLRHLKLA